jgi:DNA modification methylase
LIGVFRVDDKPNLNNTELDRHGRNRTNVWEFAGINSFGKGRLDDLAAHPTVKPVSMIVEAIKDCTKRGDIVLDVFAGSVTTMLAAERLGRRCRSLEYEPRYVDVAIRRWQAFTGKDAIHVATGSTFDEMAIAAPSWANPEAEAA